MPGIIYPAIDQDGIELANFGGDPSGVGDSTQALAQAILASSNKTLYARPGTYRLTQPIHFSAPIAVRGDGEALTIFDGSGVTGKVFSSGTPGTPFFNARFSGFRIDCGNNITTTHGFDLTGIASAQVTDVRVQRLAAVGAFGFFGDTTVGVIDQLRMYGVYANNITNGDGYWLRGFGMSGVSMMGISNRRTFSFLGGESDFANLLSSDNTGTNTGGGTLTLQGVNRININNLVTDDSSQIVVFLQGTNCILSNFYLSDNNQAAQNPGFGMLYVQGMQNCKLNNWTIETVFLTQSASEVLWTMDSQNATVNSHNQFSNMRLIGNNIAKGIQWIAGTPGLNNQFANVDTTGCPNVDTPNETSGRFVNTIGVPRPAPAAIAVGGSPFTYTNSSTYYQIVTVQGGTVSAIALRGTTITGATSGTYYLYPGDTLQVTYSVLPVMWASSV